VPFGLMQQLFGGGQGQAGQAQAAIGQGQNQQAIANQIGQAGQQANGALQAGDVNWRHQMVIQQGIGGAVEYIPMVADVQRGAPQRRRDVGESIQAMANDWIMQGMEFVEIVVPDNVYRKLTAQLANPFHAADDFSKQLRIATSIGWVSIIPESNRQKFNLDKYMETVE
jgi:hypothetical protein